jgi:hypothetical protein
MSPRPIVDLNFYHLVDTTFNAGMDFVGPIVADEKAIHQVGTVWFLAMNETLRQKRARAQSSN